MTKHIVIGKPNTTFKSDIGNISLFDDKGKELKIKHNGQLQDIQSQLNQAGKGVVKDGIITGW